MTIRVRLRPEVIKNNVFLVLWDITTTKRYQPSVKVVKIFLHPGQLLRRCWCTYIVALCVLVTSYVFKKTGLTRKSSLACAPRDSLRASAANTVWMALRTRFCISSVSTRSVFHTFPLSYSCMVERERGERRGRRGRGKRERGERGGGNCGEVREGGWEKRGEGKRGEA